MNLSLKISRALIFTILLATNTVVQAQNFTVTGTVINAETGLAVEFANIGVEDTYLGTASDLNGNFEIALSRALIKKQISVSAVGYKTKSYQVSDWEGKQGLIVQLAPVNYGISEVNVAAKSKIGYGIIRAASNLVVDNYLNHPYSYQCYLKTVVSSKGNNTQDEALFILSDSKGYGERSYTEAFQNIHYHIQENNPHKPIGQLREGLTFIDQLISGDIVRNPGNILSVETINEFDVKILGQDVLGSDSVWVIAYSCKKPTFHNTGDPELNEYKGTIWISHKDNAVLKNNFSAQRKGESSYGNSFYNNDIQSQPMLYQVKTTYQANGDRYILKSVNYIQEKSDGTKTSVYLKVVEVTDYNDQITRRQYFNGGAKDDNFWNSFKRPQ